MITNTTIWAFIIGALLGLVFLGARAWFKDLEIKMNWWKWILSFLWYLLLLFFVLAAFTFVGEGEKGAGYKLLGAIAVLMSILGVGLYRVLKHNNPEIKK